MSSIHSRTGKIELEEALIRSAVKIFCEARDEWWEEEEGREAGRAWPLCLGAAGPYGAYLADGSEYRGNYGITDEQLKISLKKSRIVT